jgi:hypothetical protein
MTIILKIPYQTADGDHYAPSVIRKAVEDYGGTVTDADETALTVELPFDVEPTFMRTVSDALKLVEVSLIPSKGVRP